METPEQFDPEDDIEPWDAGIPCVSEEVIFDEFDVGAGKKMPLTLRTYENGVQKLHWGITENFGQQLEKIKVLLEERGLRLDSLNLGQFYPEGMFLVVEPKGRLAYDEVFDAVRTDNPFNLERRSYAETHDISDKDETLRAMRNSRVNEEILVNEYDTELCKYVPVTLLTYKSTGGQELHREQSAQFDEHVKQAATILRERGLEVSPPEFATNFGSIMAVKPAGTATGDAKQRLLVMDGESHLQVWQGGAWHDSQVKPAGELGPGMYALYLASPALEDRVYDGMIVHVDEGAVYQKLAGGFARHDIGKFSKVPAVGEIQKVSYEWGRAVLAPGAVTRGRGMH